MDPNKYPDDLKSLIEHMKAHGWIPRKFGEGENKYDVEYSNGTFYLNLEKEETGRIHIEYEDYWDE